MQSLNVERKSTSRTVTAVDARWSSVQSIDIPRLMHAPTTTRQRGGNCWRPLTQWSRCQSYRRSSQTHSSITIDTALFLNNTFCWYSKIISYNIPTSPYLFTHASVSSTFSVDGKEDEVKNILSPNYSHPKYVHPSCRFVWYDIQCNRLRRLSFLFATLSHLTLWLHSYCLCISPLYTCPDSLHLL